MALKYLKETTRLKTFGPLYPFSYSEVQQLKNCGIVDRFANFDKKLLAKQGLYFDNSSNLVCFFCKAKFDFLQWQPHTDPIWEHFNLSPNCPLLLGNPTFNKPINQEELDSLLSKVSVNQCSTSREAISLSEVSVNQSSTSREAIKRHNDKVADEKSIQFYIQLT